MSREVWEPLYRCHGRFGRICQLCAPHTEAAGSDAILNIFSMAGDNKNIKLASYSSSKAAETHLTRNISFDLGLKNIRVNAIAPGLSRPTH